MVSILMIAICLGASKKEEQATKPDRGKKVEKGEGFDGGVSYGKYRRPGSNHQMWIKAMSYANAKPTTSAAGPLVVRLRTDTNVVFVEEPISGVIKVTNVSPKPVALMTSWLGSDNVKVVISVSKDQGKSRERKPFRAPSTPMIEKVSSLRTGDDYQAPISIPSSKPGRYTLTVSVEFTGKATYYDRDAGRPRDRKAAWAGKITSEPLTITVSPLVKPVDISALKVLRLTEGPRYNMWYPHSTTTGGDSRFRTILKKYPRSVFAKHAELAEARVWAGDLQPQSGPSYDKAIAHLTRLLNDYPPSYISDDAEFLLARVYLHREKSQPGKGYRQKAIKHLRHLVATYSKSNSVKPAKKLLASAMKTKETKAKNQ